MHISMFVWLDVFLGLIDAITMNLLGRFLKQSGRSLKGEQYMKRFLAIILAGVIMLALFGCAAVINTETELVKATIIEVDKDPQRVTMVGKTPVIHPADYDIRLQYESVEMWIDVTRDEYYKYEALVGTTVDARLTTIYYDDNTVKYRLELVED